MKKVQKQYDNISEFYEIFYSGVNKEEIYKSFIEMNKEQFNLLSSNSMVCDCSCGNGLQAIAMKKYGINIIASDISKEMINLTKKNAEAEGITFPILNLSWSELSKDYSNYFDLVFCWGNSISHSLSKEEMINNLKSIYSTMKKSGKLVIETRNWDKILQNKQRYFSYDEKIYNGKRVVPIYIMNIIDFDVESDLEMIFIEIDDSQKTLCNGFKLNFTPFSHQEFIKRLNDLEFKIVEDSFNDSNDFYTVIVEK